MSADNDGSDWSLGVTSKLGQMPHDGGMDFDGNVYFTNNNPNRLATVGKVNGKTGELKWLKVDGRNGLAANAHGLTRDGDGNFWFDVNPGRRSLGKLDAKTEKISVYQTPVQHVAARRRRDHGRRRQGQDLGLGSGWRRALRSR